MSIGPLGIAAGAAGTPLAQTLAAVENAQGELGARGRQVYHEHKAEAAAGVGEPDGENHQTDQRDADGRREWEEPPESAPSLRPPGGQSCKDPSGDRGNLLDLTG